MKECKVPRSPIELPSRWIRVFYCRHFSAAINRCKSTCHSVIYGVVSTYAKESNKDEAG